MIKNDQNWIQVDNAVVSMQDTYIHRIVKDKGNFKSTLLLSV